jgi:hypothetical protein
MALSFAELFGHYPHTFSLRTPLKGAPDRGVEVRSTNHPKRGAPWDVRRCRGDFDRGTRERHNCIGDAHATRRAAAATHWMGHAGTRG